MGLKNMINMFQKINKENIPNPSKMSQEEYSKHVTNQFARNIITDIAAIGGFDTDGDVMSIQGIKVAFNLQTGTFKYVHDDDKFPEKVFRCIYNHNYKDYDLIIFATEKEEILDILRSRLVLIRPDIIHDPKCISSNSSSYRGCTFISRQIENVNIEDAYEITNSDDCRIYEDKDKLTLWIA